MPDETTAPLVRQAFELFSTGNHSLRSLSEEMFHRGLTTRYGKMYSEENTKKLLAREFYIGRIVWHGKVYAGKHQPIVPKDLFYRVQEVLKSRSVDTGEKGRLEFLLRGVAYCRPCNRRLTGEIHPRGSYYRCLPNINQQKCSERYIPVKLLDGQLAALYERLQPPKEFLELLKAEMHEIAKRRKRLAERELGALKRTIAETENKELRLLDEMLAERVPRGTYEKMEKAYREKREQAEARLSQLEVDYGDPLDFLDKCAVVAGMLAYLHHRFTFRATQEPGPCHLSPDRRAGSGDRGRGTEPALLIFLRQRCPQAVQESSCRGHQTGCLRTVRPLHPLERICADQRDGRTLSRPL